MKKIDMEAVTFTVAEIPDPVQGSVSIQTLDEAMQRSALLGEKGGKRRI